MRVCGARHLQRIICPRLPRYREPRRGWAWSYFTLAGSSNRPSMDCGRIVLPSSIARRPLSVVSFPSRGLGPRLQTHEEHRGCCEARQSNLRRRKRLGGLDFIGIFARPTTRVWTFVEPCTVRYTGPPMGQRQQTHVPTGHRQLPVWGAKPCGEVCTETSPRPFPCDGSGLFDLCRQHQTGHCSRTRRAGECESAPFSPSPGWGEGSTTTMNKEKP